MPNVFTDMLVERPVLLDAKEDGWPAEPLRVVFHPHAAGRQRHLVGHGVRRRW